MSNKDIDNGAYPNIGMGFPISKTRSGLATESYSYLSNAQYVENKKHLDFADIQKHTGPNTALFVGCTMPKKSKTVHDIVLFQIGP